MSDSLRAKHWPKASYDPRYDPLTDAGPGHNRDYAPTYWIGTAGIQPEDDGPVSEAMDVDVVVVRWGYTGLSCAIHLAKEHGIKATVLEANTLSWGCSTRNGGQAQISSYYALGYGGDGVVYSAQAGRRMAQMIAGKGDGLDLPIFTSALPSHGVLTPFRRIGQRFMYLYYYLNDEMR